MKAFNYILYLGLLFNIFSPAVLVKAQDPLRIMPLGNSITRGSMCLNGTISGCVRLNDSEAIGYRYRLFNLLSAAGYNFDFTGNNKSGYSLMTDPDNAGFSGIRSQDLATLIATGSSSYTGQVTPGPYLNHYPTDIILLHIGTNDVLANSYSVSEVQNLLNTVDNYETASGQPVLVLIARIISQKGYPCNTHSGTKTFNTNLTNMVQTRKNNGDLIILADMECGAGLNYSADLIDEVHPNQTGYDKMADLWFQTINTINNAPVVSTIPDQNKDRGVSFNSINLDSYVTDAEDSDANITWTTIPSQPQYFNLTIDQNRVATISPKSNLWSGSEIIEFVATDKGKIISKLRRSDQTAVEFKVNWTPEIIGQNPLNTPEDVAITLSVNNLVIVEPEKAPSGISLIVQSGNNYTVSGTTVTPNLNYNGTLSVPVKISVNGKESNTYNLQIGVTPVNDKPVINNQVSIPSIKQGSCINLELSMLSVTDADNTYPTGFSLQILSGSNYSYSGRNVCPSPSFSGNLIVTLRVNDGIDYSNTFAFSITVYPDKPVFILPQDLEALQNETYSGEVSIQHNDPGAFTLAASKLPTWLSFNSTTKTLQGTPANKDVGNHEVILNATDGDVSADTTFIFTVLNVNDPPVIKSQPVTTARTGLEYRYEMIVEDIDVGDILTYSYSVKPSWAVLNPSSGVLSGTPGRTDEGVHDVLLKVTDGEYEVQQNFSITVALYNFPPVIITEPIDTVEINNLYTYGISAEDPDMDPLTYFAKDLPGWLAFYPSTRVLIGTPGIKDAGSSSLVVLAVSDGMDTTYQAYYLKVVFPTSLFEIPAEHSHKVYPNPASSLINISIDNQETGFDDMHFEIHDMAGRIILKERIYANQTALPIDSRILPNGIYFYRLYKNKDRCELKSGKLVIQSY